MQKNDSREYILNLLVSVLLGGLSAIISLFIFAVIFTVLDLELFYNAVFATLSLIIGCFIGSSVFVNKMKSKGFLNGITVALIIYAIVFVASLIFSDNGFSLSSLFHLAASLLSGAIGGILQVNKKSKYNIWIKNK